MPLRLAARLGCAIGGVASVFPLLGWAYRLAPFRTLVLAVAIPGLALLIAAGLHLRRSGAFPALAAGLAAGCVGGVLGTVLYDAARAPELALGLRPFAPISSYGLLILDARYSSGLTELAGWDYNMANGIGFGLAYGAVAGGRRWYWALPWAMALETASIVTPVGDIYAIRGQWVQIAFAYLGHVFYAIPLGLLVQDAERFSAWFFGQFTQYALAALLVATAAVEFAWHQPWSDAPPASPRIADGRLAPQWLRLPVGGCISIGNRDGMTHQLSGASPGILPPSGARECFARAGVIRVLVDGAPFSGGYVIVDPELGS